jgi:hypothetical protein
MRLFVLGAGASKAYAQSPSGQRMPVARDFFETFLKLQASENPWVLLGAVMAYLTETRGVHDLYGYLRSGIDIEDLHSEIEAAREVAVDKGARPGDLMVADSAFSQLVFLFAATINEIQSGPVSEAHRALVSILEPDDAVVTFNWDTLLDRALAETTDWQPDWGYSLSPRGVFVNGWTVPRPRPADAQAPELIKLHGSTNWLTAYAIRDLQTGEVVLTHDLDPSAFGIFVVGDKPYPCHAGRFMAGYEPYSYGYYPPNLDFPGRAADADHAIVQIRPRLPWRPEGSSGDAGLVSMPLIIPPVRNKSYDMFGDLFGNLWKRAEDLLAKADSITVIGYSFPKTDVQSDRLFRAAFSRRTSIPHVRIVDPAPAVVAEKFRRRLGIPDSQLEVLEARFTAELAATL